MICEEEIAKSGPQGGCYGLMERPLSRAAPQSDAESGASTEHWLKWAVIFGAWTLFGVLNASTIYFETRYVGMSHSWWRMVVWQVLTWDVWACFAPLILWLGQRFSLDRATWARTLSVHLVTFTVLVAIHTAIGILLTIYIEPFDEMGRPYPPFAEHFLKRLTGNFTSDLLIYGIILGTGYAFDYYRKYRERETLAAQLEAKLAQAQLQSLKMQLHPHFLFNTLNGIAALVRDKENRAAVNMLVGLSTLLRHALENAGRQEVSLREELDFLELYFDIQQMRFSDRLRVEMKIEPETLEARVPNLILQPLVENAVRYGVAPRVSAGVIGVSARREKGSLQLRVYDDGPGLTRGWILEQSKGIGLSNTRARLEQLYGPAHSFVVRNREEGGVEALISLPLRLASEDLDG
jgi:two-component system, LytTR family, sensor kinase